MTGMISSSALSQVLPLIILTVGALLTLLFEVFIKHEWRKEILSATAIVAAVGSYAVNSALFEPHKILFSGHLYADPFALFFSLFILVVALASIILGIRGLAQEGVESSGEYHALFLFGLVGALVLVSAANFITLFLGLEILSMALYALCASAPGRTRSSEAALKYFLLGSFSSVFLLYGIALLYGLTGSLELASINAKLVNTDSYLPMVAFVLITVGVLFKLGAVPFHSWIADVYQGAPTPITAFMACAVKAAAAAVVLRVVAGVFGDLTGLWSGLIACCALLTMIVGNIVALQQRSMKRMLAFSSVAHAGYLLVGVLAVGPQYGGAAAIAFYLVSYAAMTFGSFAIVQIVSAGHGSKKSSDDVSRFQGLSSTHPFLAGCMALFLFSLAGLPPGVSGLVSKFFIFSAAVRADYVILSIVGVLASAVSCYYYLRVVVAMYFLEPPVVEGEGAAPAYSVSLPLAALLLLAALLVVLLGIFPARLFEVAQYVTASLL
jgi:NADH-quinone oxidoreductase subunit N